MSIIPGALQLDGYQPTARVVDQRDWERVRPFVVDLVGTVRWASLKEARSVARTVASLLLFTERCGYGLDPWVALRPEMVEQFASVALAGRATQSVASIRSRLRMVGRVVHPTLWPDPVEYGRSDTPGPYSDGEVAGLLAAADALGSALFRRRALAVVLLGVGAGLGSSDLRHLTGRHVVRAADGALEVRVPDPTPRVVPVLDCWADRLETVAGEVGADLVIGRSSQQARHNLTTKIASKMDATGATVRLSQARLRLTWVVAQVTSGTPVDVIMGAAGVTTLALVQQAVEHVPPTDPTRARLALRGARR